MREDERRNSTILQSINFLKYFRATIDPAKIDTVSGSYVDVPNSYEQAVRMALFFFRVLAPHHGGPGPIPGRDMSVLGPLQFRMGITLVKSLHYTIL